MHPRVSRHPPPVRVPDAVFNPCLLDHFVWINGLEIIQIVPNSIPSKSPDITSVSKMGLIVELVFNPFELLVYLIEELAIRS